MCTIKKNAAAVRLTLYKPKWEEGSIFLSELSKIKIQIRIVF